MGATTWLCALQIGRAATWSPQPRSRRWSPMAMLTPRPGRLTATGTEQKKHADEECFVEPPIVACPGDRIGRSTAFPVSFLHSQASQRWQAGPQRNPASMPAARPCQFFFSPPFASFAELVHKGGHALEGLARKLTMQVVIPQKK